MEVEENLWDLKIKSLIINAGLWVFKQLEQFQSNAERGIGITSTEQSKPAELSSHLHHAMR